MMTDLFSGKPANSLIRFDVNTHSFLFSSILRMKALSILQAASAVSHSVFSNKLPAHGNGVGMFGCSVSAVRLVAAPKN
ncbi:hypothetical protein [Budvicia aquatica]|uniref:Uncharacterized protein n=2 Tax=Budvicia aquatica TaxID=82979 RepID=A0A484ZUF7_9GAMM|nr:hypothetical protein [Budvicia aquatica]VFS52034.1 Uncharacterised protein [Budvicia aquatica]